MNAVPTMKAPQRAVATDLKPFTWRFGQNGFRAWGDDFPAYYVGRHTFLVDPTGRLHENILDLFLDFYMQPCDCSDRREYLGKVRDYLKVIETGLAEANPQLVLNELFGGSALFQGIFNDMLEAKDLVRHSGAMLPLKLSTAGEAALMMLQRELPASNSPLAESVTGRVLLEAPTVEVVVHAKREQVAEPTAQEPDPRTTQAIKQAQADSTLNWALQMGVYRMNRDGTFTESRKYRTYSPEQLRMARRLTKAKRLLAEQKAQKTIQAAIDAGCPGLTDNRLTIEAKPVV